MSVSKLMMLILYFTVYVIHKLYDSKTKCGKKKMEFGIGLYTPENIF